MCKSNEARVWLFTAPFKTTIVLLKIGHFAGVLKDKTQRKGTDVSSFISCRKPKVQKIEPV